MVTSSKEGSEISKGHKRKINTGIEPAALELEAGTYLYCQCGYSKAQPFCDGSHHGTNFKPLLFEVKQKQKIKLCTCKLTSKPPYCDNSHLKLKSGI
jgi:CDGSH-type Zn-finger protein